MAITTAALYSTAYMDCAITCFNITLKEGFDKNLVKFKQFVDNLIIMEPNMKEADVLFKRISSELSPKFKGKIVAIDTDSGNYFVGNSELDAYKKAIRRYPRRKFIFKRIGFDSTHFVGAL